MVALSLASMSSTGQGAPLNLTPGVPDMMADFIQVNYDPGSQSFLNFSAAGYVETIDFDQVAPPDYNIDGTQAFQIQARILSDGSAPQGSIVIDGHVNHLAPNGSNHPLSSDLNGPLLTGHLTAFGYPTAGSGALEFLFAVDSGSAAPYYHGQVGVILSANGYAGRWDQAFSNGGFGVADNFAPEPVTLMMLAAGLPLVLRRRARKA
jgi:hypothetical protein